MDNAFWFFSKKNCVAPAALVRTCGDAGGTRAHGVGENRGFPVVDLYLEGGGYVGQLVKSLSVPRDDELVHWRTLRSFGRGSGDGELRPTGRHVAAERRTDHVDPPGVAAETRAGHTVG